MEEIPEITPISSEDYCIKLFEETTTTTEDNKLVVRLPFEDNKELGDSRKQAMARFRNSEKRMDNETKEAYIEFMRDYEAKGHMQKTIPNLGKYYLPHQAVIRKDTLRKEKSQPICEYKLTTVTNGTSAAPFLAKKSLAYIGENAKDDYIKKNYNR